MSIQDLVFIGLSVVTLLGALLAVWHPNVFYNALALILCLFGVAALFIYLHAEFLAVIQIVIYVGAVSIAIIFAIMLSKPWIGTPVPRNNIKMARAVFISMLLFGGLTQLVIKSQWPSNAEGDFSIQAIGRSLLNTYALPFEVVSLVLLVAIIGALVVSGSNKESA